jgi:hypothetical protein
MTSAVVTRATKSVDVTWAVDDDGCLISSIQSAESAESGQMFRVTEGGIMRYNVGLNEGDVSDNASVK